MIIIQSSMNEIDDKGEAKHKKKSYTPELKLLLFFMVYLALVLILSQFYIHISCNNSGCSVSITNWYLFGFFIAVGILRLVGYSYRKIKTFERKEEQKEIGEDIEESQKAFEDDF